MGPVLLVKHLSIGDMKTAAVEGPAVGLTGSTDSTLPDGGAPAMKDGDFALAESNSILRYLARKYGKDLYPEEELEFAATIDSALDVFARKIYPHVVAIAYPVMGYAAPKTDFIKECEACAADLETFAKSFLSKGKFCGGEKLTVADFKLAPFFFVLALPEMARATGVRVPKRIATYVADFQKAVPAAAMLAEYGGVSLKQRVASKAEFDRRMREQASEFERNFFGGKGAGKGAFPSRLQAARAQLLRVESANGLDLMRGARRHSVGAGTLTVSTLTGTSPITGISSNNPLSQLNSSTTPTRWEAPLSPTSPTRSQC